jgi:predicted kinase
MKVLILKGLPASGKSTHAKELAKDGNWKRVNKDDLRAMLDNGVHGKANERFVCAVRDLIIVEALAAHKNVVVDDTNFNPIHEENIRHLVASFKPDIEVKLIEATVEECIERNAKRANGVPEHVIRAMYNKYLKPKDTLNTVIANQYKAPEGTPKTLLVDIDGTLAHMTGRGAHDYHRVYEDELDFVVASIVQRYKDDGYTIVILSGRNDGCKDVTEQWLQDKKVPYDLLLMRKEGDFRQDAIVKQEIFDAYVRDKFDIEFVLDDRNQVVKMWRDNGLKVLQVADGDF